MKATTIKWAFLFKKPVDSCVRTRPTGPRARSARDLTTPQWVFAADSSGQDHAIQASIALAADRAASCLRRSAAAGPEALSAPSQGKCLLAEYPQCTHRRHRAHVES